MIISKITTKNFKILKNFTWELNEGINLIYGDNASGKSTLIEIFEFLDEVFTRESNIKAELQVNPYMNPVFINNNMMNMNRALYERYKTIGSKNHEPIEITIEYSVGSKRYEYYLELEKGDLVAREWLVAIGKKEAERIVFKRVDKKGNYQGELVNEISELGNLLAVNSNNNSLISRILYLLDYEDMNDLRKVNSFPEILNLIDGFAMINRYARGNEVYEKRLTLHNGEIENILLPYQRVNGFNSQTLREVREIMNKQVRRFAKVATELDNNIIDVVVEERKSNQPNSIITISPESNVIEFVMCFIKMIDNKEVSIEYNIESNGTKNFLKYFKTYELLFKKVSESNKRVTLFDEFGANLHDALTQNIFKDIAKATFKRNKQIIFTTHCTDLLTIHEKWFDNKNKYILKNDLGNISLKNLKGIDVKENNKIKYINGAYGGNSSLMNEFEIEELYE